MHCSLLGDVSNTSNKTFSVYFERHNKNFDLTEHPFKKIKTVLHPTP